MNKEIIRADEDLEHGSSLLTSLLERIPGTPSQDYTMISTRSQGYSHR